MDGRDERGRLKLPSANYIPFQRVQTRSTRGSKNSSRQESPEHSANRNRSRQWGSTESKRSSRSQSFNVSELSNSKDEDHNGYYFDEDNANDDEKPRRQRYKHHNPRNEDISKSLSNLSVSNARRHRSKSLSNGLEKNEKMPYIPFQRVKHIRTRSKPPEPEKDFQVPAFTSMRDRRDFRYKYDTFHRNNGYMSEYRSRYLQRDPRSRLKASRKKNESHLTDLLRDKGNRYHTPPDDKDKQQQGIRNDAFENGREDYERSIHSRQSTQGSKHSGSSNSHDEGNILGLDDRPGSSSSSVKFPQIQPSPVMSIESAKSVNGTGAVPSRPTSTWNNLDADTTSNEFNKPHVENLHPVDTSRWVEGKGAGRLGHFFKEMRIKNEPIITHEAVNVSTRKEYSDANWNELNLAGYKITGEKTVFPKSSQRKSVSRTPNISDHTSKIMHRSKSDPAIFSKVSKEAYFGSQHKQNLKSNEIIIFKDNSATKYVKKGVRPRTSLPRIILTMADNQTLQGNNGIVEKAVHKNINKGATNLPKILTMGSDNKSLQLQNGLKNNIRRSKKKPVISSLHKSQKSKNKNDPKNKKGNSMRQKTKYPSNDNQKHFLNVTNYPTKEYLSLTASKTDLVTQQSENRFSKSNGLPSHNRRPPQYDEAKLIDLTGGSISTLIQKHIGDIKLQRTRRLERFSQFLGTKDKTDQTNEMKDINTSQDLKQYSSEVNKNFQKVTEEDEFGSPENQNQGNDTSKEKRLFPSLGNNGSKLVKKKIKKKRTSHNKNKATKKTEIKTSNGPRKN